ncbi:hypothetical protein JW979_16265 [bacterium]|nr:hypothetical protein [candidate division CSSED10-310 bacterium]
MNQTIHCYGSHFAERRYILFVVRCGRAFAESPCGWLIQYYHDPMRMIRHDRYHRRHRRMDLSVGGMNQIQ